jgi:hypothetical protein
MALDKMIGHFEVVSEHFRLEGKKDSTYAEVARFLKRLRHYEAAIASGKLVWKEEEQQ